MSELQIATIDAIVGVFEGGRPFRYETVARVQSDPGGLSYGKHQVSHTSGNLHRLMCAYCDMPKADSELSAKMKKQLSRLKVPAPQSGEKEKQRLASLEDKRKELMADDELKDLMISCAADRAMGDAQDKYFFDNFMVPALTKWKAFGFVNALSAAVAYDSQIQSGVAFRAAQKEEADQAAGAPSAANEKEWIAAYVAARRKWLSESGSEAVRSSVYRMDAMKALIDGGHWDLALPLTVHGYELTAWDDFSTDAIEPFGDGYRRAGADKFGTLARTTKWTGRGRFVNRCLVSLKYLQPRLAKDLGKFDDVAVAALKAFQTKVGLPATGQVDAATFDRLCADAAVADDKRAKAGPASSDGFKDLPPEQKTKAPVGSTVAAGAAATAAGVGAAMTPDGGGAKTDQAAANGPAGAPETADVPSSIPASTPSALTADTHPGGVVVPPPASKPFDNIFKGPTGTVLICVAFVLTICLIAFTRRRWS